MPHLMHDLQHLTHMIQMTHDPAACDSVTGRSLHTLRKVGERLSVDRLDASLGYIPGNTQLLAMSLNTAKGSNAAVPAWATLSLLRKLRRTVDDKLSSTNGVTAGM